jgi:hypothetical protein
MEYAAQRRGTVMTSRLVTVYFSDRCEAEQAATRLAKLGVDQQNIYLEEPPQQGVKRGESTSPPPPRGIMGAWKKWLRLAGMEVGLTTGMTLGFLIGLAVALLAHAIQSASDTTSQYPPLPVLLLAGAIGGAVLGLAAGGLAAALIQWATERLDARPQTLSQQTLVSIRCEEDLVDVVSGALTREQAYDLNILEPASLSIAPVLHASPDRQTGWAAQESTADQDRAA